MSSFFTNIFKGSKSDTLISRRPAEPHSTYSNTDAPQDLYDLVSQAIDTRSVHIINELERRGHMPAFMDFSMERMIYSNVFSKQQLQKLQIKIDTVREYTMRKASHIIAMHIIMNGGMAPDEKQGNSNEVRMMGQSLWR